MSSPSAECCGPRRVPGGGRHPGRRVAIRVGSPSRLTPSWAYLGVGPPHQAASSPAVAARTHTIGASGSGGIEPTGRTAVHSMPLTGSQTAHRGKAHNSLVARLDRRVGATHPAFQSGQAGRGQRRKTGLRKTSAWSEFLSNGSAGHAGITQQRYAQLPDHARELASTPLASRSVIRPNRVIGLGSRSAMRRRIRE